ncbi:MAG: trypsin-like peptidase domain-containing protein [Aquimonas sp.]|jgi:serine protease DegQ|nr:trypsin-like peptidase domain-containing protein [Xanthomonadales bacterium]MCC6504789.1 trypsin-like peptidase domain-containing protein [Aquimonas sp.]
MPHAKRYGWFLLHSVVAGLAAAFVISQVFPAAVRWMHATTATASDAHERVISYADAVRSAAPAVVSIYADKLITEQTLIRVPSNSTVQRFSGLAYGPPRTRLERALGSGVIVTEDGYVLTNHHVIAGASQIRIALWDGRVTQANLIGSDADTDLAVLKMEGSALPALTLDPEVPKEVGDVVLAIGNPFGLSQTVTQGIVSGLSRNQLNLRAYEDFIQTDAAINEGNSGGALINARGQLIGINTFVLGRINGAEGIGFAIPMGTASAVFEEIKQHGIVVRGWMGAEYGDAPLLPGSLDTGAARGVALTAIYSGGPAHAAGLKAGDVLLKFNGETISDQGELRLREAGLSPGQSVNISGLRAGVPFDVTLDLAQRPISTTN